MGYVIRKQEKPVFVRLKNFSQIENKGEALDLLKRNEHVIPIIGDATLTCGLALEGLNNIDEKLKKFIVILNDNKMSISQNVGAIPKYLNRLICTWKASSMNN